MGLTLSSPWEAKFERSVMAVVTVFHLREKDLLRSLIAVCIGKIAMGYENCDR